MLFLKKQWQKRMQAFSTAAPAAYSGFMLFLAAIGYGFLLLFPLLALCSLLLLGIHVWHNPSFTSWQLSDWVLAASLPVISALCLYQTMHIFKVRPPLPPGRPLLRKDFPVLLDRIDELCKTYGAPKIDHVKLNTRFEIKIVCTPKTGFPAGCINTLLIGLPVMSCMSPLHLKLLLAREIGHLALRKHHYMRRIMYLNFIWQQYAAHYAEHWQPGTALLRLFFVPYASFFNTSVTPAIRQECFVKDRCLLDITPSNNVADVVAIHAIKRRYLNESFWPVLNNKAFTEARPPYLPYSAMGMVINKSLDKVSTQILYEAEIAHVPEIDSNIPNLRERLLAIGYDDFVVPDSEADNAAKHFLGESFAEIQKQMDNIWYLKNKSIWAMRYKRGMEEKARLKILHDQAVQGLLSNDEAHEYLLLIEKHIPLEKALPYYNQILKTNSLDAKVCYEAGRLLLTAGDEKGISALQMAMDLSDALTVDSCQHIIEYLTKTGDTKKAQDYRRKILAYQVES
jgi:hypothetical protein